MAVVTTAGNVRPRPPSHRPRIEEVRACCLLATLSLGLWASAVAADGFIRSRVDLEAHLRDHAADSPLNSLSPGARERFLYSLRFGDQGLTGADGGDLADELTQEQINAVMSLFGPEVARLAPPSLRDEVQTLERKVRSRDVIGEIERRYNEFYKACRDITEADSEQRFHQKAVAFDRHVAAVYTTKSLARADDRELRLLRQAAGEVALGTRRPRHVDAYQAVFAERERRRLLSSGDLEMMQSLLVSLHRVADARRLREKYPGSSPPLPIFRDPLGKSASRYTAWRLDADGKRLTREAVELSGTRILVTASCHFSKDALRDIGADARLAPAFARHAVWLSQAPGVESITAVQDWNREFTRTPILMIHDRDEWSLLPRWRMPEFYVVRDGQVIDSAFGWVRDSAEHREALASLLARHGLLD